jgi:hypothetical protein
MYKYLTNDVIFDRWQQVGSLINDGSDLVREGWELVSCVPLFDDGQSGKGVACMIWRQEVVD